MTASARDNNARDNDAHDVGARDSNARDNNGRDSARNNDFKAAAVFKEGMKDVARFLR